MGMALDEPKENEKPVEINGIGVLIEEFTRPLMDDITIDYIKRPDGEGFIIEGSGGSC
jgi:Fe-S cluster assembly iron-binding protein IscA